MAIEGKTPEATRGPARNLLPALIVVLLLSLSTWLFFQLESLPLNGPATTVVVGAWFLVVFLARAIWQHFRKKGV
jgi:hypothetical protein